jgi:type I restriction enzyme R subunit
VCEQIAEEIDPHLDDKTLVFCVDDAHATEVTELLKAALDKRWGASTNDAVMKITGAVDRPLEQIRRYRNERQPSRRGHRRPAHHGHRRAAHLQPRVPAAGEEPDPLRADARPRDAAVPGDRKESFRVYDAVGQTELIGDLTGMKPTGGLSAVHLRRPRRRARASPRRARARRCSSSSSRSCGASARP